MSTGGAAATPSSSKTKKGSSGADAPKKGSVPAEDPPTRKVKGEEGKTSKSSKNEDGVREKRKSKHKSGEAAPIGNGEPEVTEAPAKPRKSSKKALLKDDDAPVEAREEKAAPAKPPKPSKGSRKNSPAPAVPPPIAEASEQDETTSDNDASHTSSSHEEPADKPSSSRPAPPKPSSKPIALPDPLPPAKDSDDDDDDTDSDAKPASGAPVAKQSDEASTLTDSDDSDHKPTRPSSKKGSKDTTSDGKPVVPAKLTKRTSKRSEPVVEEETEETDSDDAPLTASDDTAPERGSKGSNAAAASTGSGSKANKHGNKDNNASATNATATTPAATKAPAAPAVQDKKEKKSGGFFGLFKKDKKASDGNKATGGHGGGAAGVGNEKKSKDVSRGKDGTGEKKKDGDEKRTYIVSSVADLPEEWQKKLKKLHLEESTLNEHFYILCNVLHFLTKDSFKLPDQPKESRDRRPYASAEMMENARALMESTDNIKKFYKNIEFSGKGGFGRVFAAKDIATKKRVAIKKLPHVTDKDKKNNYCEISFLSTCNHPNIVKYSKAWDFSDKGEAWIVTEFLEGGTLSEAVKVHQFTERHIAYVAREILKALKYLHSMGYIHRDLKSGNVMMSIEGQIKLIDFGLCCDTVDGDRLQMLGSPYWIPPEMIKKKRHGCPADIWSFAVCVLEMYLKEPPNCDSRLYAMFTAASSGLQSAIPARASEHARDFLTKCLEINPKKRWTAEQLLTHPFVTAPKLEEGIRDVLRGVFVSNSLALSGI